MSFTEFLDDTVTIKIPTYSDDDVEGGETPSYPAGTAVACYVRDARSMRQSDQGRVGAAATHIVYFAADPGVKANDQLAWGSRKLTVLGPADHVSDPVGDEEYWSVFARERS